MDSFNSITRDINDIRERARIGQLSRKQRKRDRKQDGSSSLFGRAFLSKQEGTTANQSSQQGQQGQPPPSSNSVANAPSRLQIPHDFVLPDWFVPAATQGVGPCTGRTGSNCRQCYAHRRYQYLPDDYDDHTVASNWWLLCW